MKFFCLCVSVFGITSNALHPNVGLDEYQIMTQYGYPYEKHDVTTDDGYIIEMARVLPRKLTSTTNMSIDFKVYPQLMAAVPGEPVFLMPGWINAGRAFVSHDANKALAFVLVNHGYDVYIGNSRGTTNRGRRHITLDPDLNQKEFWEFSWHEIAVFDQPAMVDYIRALTGFDKVSYIGHSQGGTTFLAMAAGRPEINPKIKIGFSLGGPGIMRYTPTTFVRRMAQFEKDIQAMTNRLEIYEFVQYSTLFRDLGKIFVDEQFGLRELLIKIMNLSGVITAYNMDVDLMAVFASSSPSGASVNEILHHMQSINKGDFRLFDYHDDVKNYQKYGSVVPPRYNLSQITCNAVLYYSKDDFFIQRKDTLLMSNQMANAVPVEIKVNKFSHADYIWARDVNDIVFKDLLWRMRNAS